jgi:hypothetical protein
VQKEENASHNPTPHSEKKQLKLQYHPLTKIRTNDVQWKCYPTDGRHDNNHKKQIF